MTTWKVTYEDNTTMTTTEKYTNEEEYTRKIYWWFNETPRIIRVEDMGTHAVYEPKYPETEDEARERAIDWQYDLNNHNYSYEDAMLWSDYFEGLAHKFPNLRDEFRENGI